MLMKTGHCLDQNSEDYLTLTGGKKHAVKIEKSMPNSNALVIILFEDDNPKEAIVKNKSIIPDYVWVEIEKEKKMNQVRNIINNFPKPSKIISHEEELDEVQINVEGFQKDIDLDKLANTVVKYIQFKTLYTDLYELFKNNFEEQLVSIPEKRETVIIPNKTSKKRSPTTSEINKVKYDLENYVADPAVPTLTNNTTYTIYNIDTNGNITNE